MTRATSERSTGRIRPRSRASPFGIARLTSRRARCPHVEGHGLKEAGTRILVNPRGGGDSAERSAVDHERDRLLEMVHRISAPSRLRNTNYRPESAVWFYFPA